MNGHAAPLPVRTQRGPEGKMAQLTDSLIRQLPLPATGSKIHYAGDPAGFGVRVTAGGARSFVLNFRVRGSGRERRYTIGKFPDWSVGDARRRAQKLRRLIAEGGDPLGDIEAERAAPTVAELCDRFEQEHLPRKRPSTAEAYSRMLRLHVRPFFGPHVKVADVVFADVDALHRRVTKAGGNYIANRVVAVLSKMFSLAVRWDMRADNPCKGIERNLEHYRRRYLSGEELVRLTTALAEHPDQQAANAIRLLLLTGARRGEVLSMRWADLDLTEGKWSKPASSTKQKRRTRCRCRRRRGNCSRRSARPRPASAGRAANSFSPATAAAATWLSSRRAGVRSVAPPT